MRRAEYVAAAVRYYRALLDKASERDKAGALSDLLISLGEHNVNVEYMYSYAEADGHAKIVFKTSAVDKAVALLKEAGAKLL